MAGKLYNVARIEDIRYILFEDEAGSRSTRKVVRIGDQWCSEKVHSKGHVELVPLSDWLNKAVTEHTNTDDNPYRNVGQSGSKNGDTEAA